MAADPADRLRELLKRNTGTVELPAGTYVIHRELVVTAKDLKLEARGVKIEIGPDFDGRAALVIAGGESVAVRGLSIDGNRDRLKRGVGGIVAAQVSGLVLEDVEIRNTSGAAMAVSASGKVRIHGAKVTDCIGGILLENGMRDFEVGTSELRHVSSPGILVRSAKGTARNTDGRIAENRFSLMARSAIQVGQSSRVVVEKNTGTQVGYPADAVGAKVIPAAIQTAGDVDAAQYRENSFEEVNGKCLGLDGFRDGEVRGNSCVNHEDTDAYPKGNFGIVMSPDSRNVLIWGNRVEGFLYGGLLLEGSGSRVSHNHFVHLNLAHCNEMPGCVETAGEVDLLRSGVYLRGGGPTRGNVVEGNEISGFGMGARCVVAGPGVEAAQNRIGQNDCSDDATLNALLVDR